MKKIALSGKNGSGKFALVDDEDFELLNKQKWHLGKGGYASGTAHLGGRGKNRPLMMHRFLMDLRRGELVDHIDGNPLNNQRANLRKCTRKENVRNRKKSPGKTSVFKGVRKKTQEYGEKEYAYWTAQIEIDGRYIHIGSFKNETEAAKAYDKKAKELFGEFARLNFPK